MAPDPTAASAILAGIRERGYRNGATGAECARLSDAAAVDVPLLVAAVEAVLKLAEPPERRHYDLDGNWEGPTTVVIPAEMIRADITAALTGTGAQTGGGGA